MLTNTFKYMRGKLDVEATVTANTCVPVGESIAGETGGGKLCKGNIKNCGNTVTATANSYVPTGELMQGETSSGKLYKGNITIEDIVTANSYA